MVWALGKYWFLYFPSTFSQVELLKQQMIHFVVKAIGLLLVHVTGRNLVFCLTVSGFRQLLKGEYGLYIVRLVFWGIAIKFINEVRTQASWTWGVVWHLLLLNPLAYSIHT